jgi:hypothetical protein
MGETVVVVATSVHLQSANNNNNNCHFPDPYFPDLRSANYNYYFFPHSHSRPQMRDIPQNGQTRLWLNNRATKYMNLAGIPGTDVYPAQSHPACSRLLQRRVP